MENKTLLLAGTQETQRQNKWIWGKIEVHPFNEKLRARAPNIRQAIQIAEALNAGLICPSSLHLSSPIIDTLTIYVNLEYASLSFAISRGISKLGFGFK